MYIKLSSPQLLYTTTFSIIIIIIFIIVCHCHLRILQLQFNTSFVSNLHLHLLLLTHSLTHYSLFTLQLIECLSVSHSHLLSHSLTLSSSSPSMMIYSHSLTILSLFSLTSHFVVLIIFPFLQFHFHHILHLISNYLCVIINV